MPETGDRNPNWRGGKSTHPLYHIYNQMVARCTTTSHKQYRDYGGRGISVCPEWLQDFWNFVRDMGERPDGLVRSRPRYVLDRIDNNSGYNPDNCRWADSSVSSSNRRETAWASGIRDKTGRFVSAK